MKVDEDENARVLVTLVKEREVEEKEEDRGDRGVTSKGSWGKKNVHHAQ